MRLFLSGDEALAEGVRLAHPQVISAYPITPQTVVVERLSDMVVQGDLDAEFIHVESEHSALACAIGASATGARTFTATSSQGLLYMAECLTYASGGRFPIVMMNATRATALPWNIYGDQRDSLSLLDHGWIQAYAQDNQEALDLSLMAYAIAEDVRVRTPYMVNLDGFTLTHTYEAVDVPSDEQACAFLPPYNAQGNQFDFDNPVNIGYSAGPTLNRYYKYEEQKAMERVPGVVTEVETRFAEIFGRQYTGLVELYHVEDADAIIVTLGAVAGLVRSVVDVQRQDGKKVGMIRIRYMRPFPNKELVEALQTCKAFAVLEQDISFGGWGSVYTNVLAACAQRKLLIQSMNCIGGLGGDDITKEQVEGIFDTLLEASCADTLLPECIFLGIDDSTPMQGDTCDVSKQALCDREGE